MAAYFHHDSTARGSCRRLSRCYRLLARWRGRVIVAWNEPTVTAPKQSDDDGGSGEPLPHFGRVADRHPKVNGARACRPRPSASTAVTTAVTRPNAGQLANSRRSKLVTHQQNKDFYQLHAQRADQCNVSSVTGFCVLHRQSSPTLLHLHCHCHRHLPSLCPVHSIFLSTSRCNNPNRPS
ncbi:hypothetical protein K437DRAFT_186791 [Tilletiaria anomala UBC 951]|uniref:Uncharacterized protein n=1 Tax=Tilletiaria anomala (strain ATCC 24038 / CBS 436.72 / UBC 951) TaxID=1037660 RepID=A0A066WF05_TILAU|nr:uncharacterized protein K437DRAFT_186791 [Tilletiaria anomala UBC 951]KDN52547.1 hypothetical protein K437DRAFT_186791 [Tilletiaria anomala UBC 951]